MGNRQKKIKIYIVDDHPLVRAGLTLLISGQSDIEICGETDNAADALRQVDATQPDLVVIDISIKGGSGLDLVKQIHARTPQIKMLVSSMHDEILFAERALRAGAMGYVNKEEAAHEIVHAIRKILDGQIYLSSRMSNQILHRLTGRPADADPSTIGNLSDREMEVFGLIGQGRTTKQIAEHLHLSGKTIETYRENLKKKLDLKNASELARRAMQWAMDQSQPKL